MGRHNLMIVLVVLALVNVPKPGSAAELTMILQQGARGFTGTRDVQIPADPRFRDQNLGGRPFTGVWRDEEVSLVAFDLSSIPRSARVTSAYLELHLWSVGHSEEEVAREYVVEAYEFTHPWSEGTGIETGDPTRDGATMATSNGKDAWPGVGLVDAAGDVEGAAVISAGLDQRWYRLLLDEALVNKWIDHPEQNNGLMIRGRAPGKAAAFYAHEHDDSEKRPILRLEISIPDRDLALLGSLAASDLTWEDYLTDCGLPAQKENEARSELVFRRRYQNQFVQWTGTVYSVKEALADGFLIGVTMDPSESTLGADDLTLIAPTGMQAQVLELNKGDSITFLARLRGQGGFILNHRLELVSIIPNAGETTE